MSPSEERPSVVLRRLVNGYQLSQAIHVAATLGIADLLADAPLDAERLAAATETHPGSLRRLLRALAAAGILEERDGGEFALTDVGACLRSDAEEPVLGWARFIGRPEHWNAWGALGHSVRTGGSAFEHVYGQSVWEHRAGHPEDAAAFDSAMTDLSRRSTRSALEAYDFGRFGTVVDVGGGRGALLAGLLAAHPGMRGVLFDQPHVVAAAEAGLDAALAGRFRAVGGSFFDGVPEGGDAYMLRAVLHDWDDPEAVAILRSCRRAMRADATVLVIERDLGPANERLETKLTDLNMLVGPGGRERTIDEYAALLDAAGLRFTGSTPAGFDQDVIEAVPSRIRAGAPTVR